jgi:bisphosphoglycerate-dependent phosphoglycerate mutase
LKDQLDDGSEMQKTPIVDESIADFYARKTQYWDEVVTKSSAKLETLLSTNHGESDI